MKRNAAVVLGNVGTVEDVPALQQALEDPEPLVREHAAWALLALNRIAVAPIAGNVTVRSGCTSASPRRS